MMDWKVCVMMDWCVSHDVGWCVRHDGLEGGVMITWPHDYDQEYGTSPFPTGIHDIRHFPSLQVSTIPPSGPSGSAMLTLGTTSHLS